jgi:hypothetical protein
VLIGFSNSIRGAKRFTASKALGDSDNDISCHARNYGNGTGFQLPFPKQAFCSHTIRRTIWVIRNVLGARVLFEVSGRPELSFPRFFCGPLEQFRQVVREAIAGSRQQQAKLRESAKKDEAAN